MRTTVFTIIVLLLAGCTTLYEPPTDPTAATLSIPSISGGFVLFTNGRDCSAQRKVPKAYTDGNRWVNVPLVAGREVAVLGVGPPSGYTGLVYSCDLMVSFVPSRSGDYRLDFLFSGSGKACDAILRKRDGASGDYLADATLRKRQFKRPLLSDQPFCASDDSGQERLDVSAQ